MPVAQPTILDTGPRARPRGRWRTLGWVVTLLVIGLVAVPILLATSLTSKPIRPVGAMNAKSFHTFGSLTGNSTHLFRGGYTVTTPVVAVPNGAGFYAIAPVEGSTTNVLRRIDPTRRQVVWSSPQLGTTEQGDPVVVADTHRVFAMFGSTVVALDAGTGHQLWQASLSNGLASPCQSGCAVLAGSRLVTLSKDGVVQAFDPATGAQTWSKRLNSTPRWLQAAGSSVLVADRAGSGPDLAVLAINAQTGMTHAIAPSCAPANNYSTPAKLTDENELFPSPDGTALTVLIAQSGGCAAQYRLRDGSPQWRTPTEQNISRIPPTLTDQSTLADAHNLVWTNDQDRARQVFALNIASGAIRQLVNDNQNYLRLVGIIGTTLTIEATPQYDPQKPAMVGVDLVTGRVKWRQATRVASSAESQGEASTSRAPIIVSCRSGGNTCTFEAIDAQRGTITGSSTVNAEPAQQAEVHLVDTPASLLATVGWGHVVGIDPATATVQWKWPS